MAVAFLQTSPRLLIVLIDPLFIEKVNVCGIDTNSLYFLASYLEKKKERTKINGSYSNFDYVFSRVPHNSILGPLLLNI